MKRTIEEAAITGGYSESQPLAQPSSSGK